MARARDLVEKYLGEGRVMQVATVSGSQPWICTVYYTHDREYNLYWLSLPTRRHSREIAKHPQVAVAIPIKQDQPVVGLQAEGQAKIVKDKEAIETIMKLYVAKYGQGQKFYENFIAGKNQHSLYKFKPKSFVLFDEVNFDPQNSRQEIKL